MTDARKFTGTTGWTDLDMSRAARVERAVLRSPDELSLGFRYEGQDFTVVLRRKQGSEFAGTFTASPRGEASTGEVSCRFLQDGSEGVLFGRWKENDISYRWFAVLDAVERFADEPG